MLRREFIRVLAGTVSTLPLIVRAQEPSASMRHIGVLQPLREDDQAGQTRIAALREGLQGLGWIEGRNLRLDIRRPGGSSAEIQKAATELVALTPDLIVASGTAALAPLLQATRTVPIVFVNVADPVGAGFVESLSRPGRNATGFTSIDYALVGKWVELLKQTIPALKRIAVLRDPTIATGIGQFGAIQSIAPSFGLQLFPMGIDPREIESAIISVARTGEGGLIVMGSSWAFDQRKLLVELAAKHKLPAIYFARDFADVGGLMSYGPDFTDGWKRAPIYIDRIFKGENPADLPVQVPTKYNLVINLKTAKTLDLTVPASVLAIADEVIE